MQQNMIKILKVFGKMSIKDIAKIAEININDMEFWRKSFDIIKDDINRFLSLSKTEEDIKMEVIQNMNLSYLLEFIHSNGLFIMIYFYLILLILIFNIFSIFYINKYLFDLNKIVKRDIVCENEFFGNLIEDFKSLLKRQRDLIDTKVFVNSYFSEHKKFTMFLINFIKKSDLLFLLLGLLGAFVITLLSIISLDFAGLNNFQELFSRMEGMINTLKPALFFLILGIIFALTMSIFEKIFNLNERLEHIKSRLVNFLENNLKYKYDRELRKIELFESLLETIDNSFLRLEDVLEDTIHDAIAELKDFAREKTTRIKINEEILDEPSKEIAFTKEEKNE
ncbi:MAG: hypothetical protein ACOC1O_03695 [bacterium]